MQCDPSPDEIRQLEEIFRLNLYKLRTADIPLLANFRRKYRWRFYRMAEAGMFLTVFNTLLALFPANPAWWLSMFIGMPLGLLLVLACEKRARQITRQLNRPAAEQIARDLKGIFD